jgi:hypothetical protein
METQLDSVAPTKTFGWSTPLLGQIRWTHTYTHTHTHTLTHAHTHTHTFMHTTHTYTLYFASFARRLWGFQELKSCEDPEPSGSEPGQGAAVQLAARL